MTTPFDPRLIAGFDQETAALRDWFAELAAYHPQVVEQHGEALATVMLAKHIEARVHNRDPDGPPPTGWMVAAVAVSMLAPLPMLLLPDGMEAVLEAELGARAARERALPLPPMIANAPPETVSRLVRRYVASDDGEICCGDHVDHCVAPAYPCCDDCPEQGDD